MVMDFVRRFYERCGGNNGTRKGRSEKKIIKRKTKKKVNRKKEEKDGPGTAKVSGSLALL